MYWRCTVDGRTHARNSEQRLPLAGGFSLDPVFLALSIRQSFNASFSISLSMTMLL